MQIVTLIVSLFSSIPSLTKRWNTCEMGFMAGDFLQRKPVTSHLRGIGSLNCVTVLIFGRHLCSLIAWPQIKYK